MLANDWRNYEMMGDYLAHHGILGQKWGVRRFQDITGKLTALGKQRYSASKEELLKRDPDFENMSETDRKKFIDQVHNLWKNEKDEGKADELDAWWLDLNDRNQKIKVRNSIDRSIEVKTFDDFKKKYKNVDFLTESEQMHEWGTNGRNKRRLEDAADEGIYTLKKVDPNNMDWDYELQRDLKDMREWFLFEDQTTGLATIVDLKRQGFSKKDIEQINADSNAQLGSRKEGDYKEQKDDDKYDSLMWAVAGINSYKKPFLDELFKDEKVEHSDSAEEIYHALFEYDEHIEHHGILGMKWGIRRFQNPDGTRTAAGKARYNEGGEKPSNPIKAIGDAMKKHKTDKQRKAALEKARQAKAAKAAEAKAKEEHEAGKQKALESGDYKEIQKYAHEVSTKELQDALTRADTLSRLNQAVDRTTPKEKDVWSTIDDAANKIGTATNAFNKGKEAWNAFAKAANTFLDEDSMLPEIGTNFAEQKEKKRKERVEKERKAKVEDLEKSLDPDKIIKNQDLFTQKELSGAWARFNTYNLFDKARKDKIDSSESTRKESSEKVRESAKELKDLEDKEKQQKRDEEHTKWQSSFDESKKRMQEELDEAVRKSQESVYSRPLSSVNAANSAKAQQAVDDVWEVINNNKSNNASDSELTQLLLTTIWDVD